MAARPDHAFGVDRDVLRDIGPALLLRVAPPHLFDRGAPLEGRKIRPPCMMHMHFDDGTTPVWKPVVEEPLELLNIDSMEWRLFISKRQ
jgi:hypothetical protein